MGDLRRLIAFDLDGTLIDSRRDLADSANALILERGGAPLSEQAIGSMVGDGAATLVRRAFEAAGLQFDDTSLRRFLELYDARLLRNTRPYPGVIEALRAVERRSVLAVLTNKPLAPTLKLLDALQLAPFFISVIGGDGPYPRKPDPRGLLSLIERHQVPARLTVLVGDSAIDAATARAAGTAFCAARYGFGAAGAAFLADADIDRAVDLPAVISQLLRLPTVGD
jgi:phosphoglycolate phosphatase